MLPIKFKIGSNFYLENDRPLKMFPVNDTKGNSEMTSIFKRYNINLSLQNDSNGRKRPLGEFPVECVDNNDVVNLSSDVSNDDCASILVLVS